MSIPASSIDMLVTIGLVSTEVHASVDVPPLRIDAATHLIPLALLIPSNLPRFLDWGTS
tara:strand:- start:7024 stop:7200 length:177 start_codon:yes stop_codon:yes gene_type:complete